MPVAEIDASVTPNKTQMMHTVENDVNPDLLRRGEAEEVIVDVHSDSESRFHCDVGVCAKTPMFRLLFSHKLGLLEKEK